MSEHVFRSIEEARANMSPASVAIGNFDGVHIGHQALLEKAHGFATSSGLKTTVLTFHPHPTVLIAPLRVPPMLCTLDQRIRRLRAAGADSILVLPFTEALALLSPEEFVTRILISTLETKAVFVGDNFRFGHKKAGTPEVLDGFGSQYGFFTTFLKRVELRGHIVSSSAIRQALFDGRLALAARLLGRCFSVEGAVVSGQGIGAKQTVPTLNILPAEGQLQLRGVYVTQTFDLDSQRNWQSITNVGMRPTFGGESLTIETFLLGPLTGAAPQNIRVEFRHYIRAEKQFPSPEALKQQIMKDVGKAQVYWRRVTMLRDRAASLY